MSRYPLSFLAKLPSSRIEIGGNTQVAEAFLPAAAVAASAIRIGKLRKRTGLRSRRALPTKRRAAGE